MGPCIRLSCYWRVYGSAFLIALLLAQSASCCASCSQNSHSPCAQQRGSLSLQKSIWRFHENPVFEVSQVVLTTFCLFRPLWNLWVFEALFFFSFLAHNTIPFISIFSMECCFHLPVSLQKCRACLLLKPEVLSLQYWSRSPPLGQFQNTELFSFATLSGYIISCKMTHQSR